MEKVKGLKCRECGKEYPAEPIHVCEFCFGPLEVVYDYEEIKKNISREKIEKGPKSLWRYIDLLPVEAHAAVSKPNSTAFERATETTLSLKERVGWFTESSFM